MTVSLAAAEPTTIDALTAFRQINWGDSYRMARLGARDRCYSEVDGYIQFDVKLTRKLRVIVKLAGDDTYSVEIGRIRKMDYVVIEQAHGVHCDQLGRVVEDLAVKWSEASTKAMGK